MNVLLCGGVLLTVGLAVPLPLGAAGIYKCTTATGVTYQGTTCRDGQQSSPSVVVNKGVDFRLNAYAARLKIERLDDELRENDREWEAALRKLWGNDTYNLQRSLDEKAKLQARRRRE